MRKLTVTLSLLFLAAMSLAQSVPVRFGSAGEREVWFGKVLPGDPPTTGVKTSQDSADLDITAAGKNDLIFVWDKASGNIAVKGVADSRKGVGWKVEPGDYQFVGQLRVEVQSSGKPVASANVMLDDGKRKQQRLVENGEATFFGIKPGSVKVTVQYNSDGKPAEPVTQILEASLQRSDTVPSMTIALPQSAATASSEPAKEGGGAKSEKDEKVAPTKPLGSILVYLVGIGVAAGVGYFVFKYFKDNPDKVGSKLEQLGVQIPKPGDDPLTNADPVVPVPAAKPAPPEKIILDDSDPLVPAGAPVAAPISMSAATPTGEPKLVSDTGDAMPLEEGELTVGREIGLGLSLVGESTVSRRHASVKRTGQTVTVQDLGSTNGTWVNGAKVSSEVTLRPGDSVQFGSVKFRYEG